MDLHVRSSHRPDPSYLDQARRVARVANRVAAHLLTEPPMSNFNASGMRVCVRMSSYISSVWLQYTYTQQMAHIEALSRSSWC